MIDKHKYNDVLQIISWITASISGFYRHIDRSKLVIHPFYAENSYQGGFQGYPFTKSDSNFVIFSGGSIYKTVDEGNTYYKMVRAILDSYPDVKFWYAGGGECDDMDLLLQDYEGRIFYTASGQSCIRCLFMQGDRKGALESPGRVKV